MVQSQDRYDGPYRAYDVLGHVHIEHNERRDTEYVRSSVSAADVGVESIQ